VVFLLPIPITLVLGLIWSSWASRPPRPADPVTTVEEWSRAIRLLAPRPGERPAAGRTSLARDGQDEHGHDEHRDRDLAHSA
jgi:hypothetical protein